MSIYRVSLCLPFLLGLVIQPAHATTVQFDGFTQKAFADVAGGAFEREEMTSQTPVMIMASDDNMPDTSLADATNSGTLSQLPGLTTLDLNGSNIAIAEWEIASNANDSLTTSFTIDDAHSYTLSASVQAVTRVPPLGFSGTSEGAAQAVVSLQGDSSGQIINLGVADSDLEDQLGSMDSINSTGVLAPGTYNLSTSGVSYASHVNSSSPVESSSSWSFSLNLMPVSNSVVLPTSTDPFDADTGGGPDTALGTRAGFDNGTNGGEWRADGMLVDPDQVDSVISPNAEAALAATRAAQAGDVLQILEMSLAASELLTELVIGYSEALLRAGDLPGIGTVEELETYLALWHWNDALARWEEIPVTVDTLANTLSVDDPGSLTFSPFVIGLSSTAPVPEPTALGLSLCGLCSSLLIRSRH